MGGFSYADVLESAKGWAGTIRYNSGLWSQFQVPLGCLRWQPRKREPGSGRRHVITQLNLPAAHATSHELPAHQRWQASQTLCKTEFHPPHGHRRFTRGRTPGRWASATAAS